MKTFSIIILLFCMCSFAHAQNFGNMNSIMISQLEYVPGPMAKEFKMYKKVPILAGIRELNGWVLEAFVISNHLESKTVTDNLYVTIRLMYVALQETTFKITNSAKTSVIIEGRFEVWNKKTTEILTRIISDLENNGKTAFEFDNLTISGELTDGTIAIKLSCK